MIGQGTDIWNASDQFHYAYKNVTGNTTIAATVTSVQNTYTWAKAAVGFPQGESVPRELSLPEILDDLERQLILKAYAKAARVKTETARILGIKTSALYYKLEKYGIE